EDWPDDVAALACMRARRIERMVEEADPPFRSCVRERRVQPCGLLRIGGVVAVQRDEPCVSPIEGVVVTVLHVERLEVLLEIAIVIAERRIKCDAAVEKRLVWPQELAV